MKIGISRIPIRIREIPAFAGMTAGAGMTALRPKIAEFAPNRRKPDKGRAGVYKTESADGRDNAFFRSGG